MYVYAHMCVCVCVCVCVHNYLDNMARAESRGSISREVRSGVRMSEHDTRKLKIAVDESSAGVLNKYILL